jgi:transcriptional regulator with XRE-family HTH domain
MSPRRAEDVAKTFGVNLKTLRTRRGLSQADLAGLAKLDQTAISRLELGLREPRISTVISLANALDVPGSELIPNIR